MRLVCFLAVVLMGCTTAPDRGPAPPGSTVAVSEQPAMPPEPQPTPNEPAPSPRIVEATERLRVSAGDGTANGLELDVAVDMPDSCWYFDRRSGRTVGHATGTAQDGSTVELTFSAAAKPESPQLHAARTPGYYELLRVRVRRPSWEESFGLYAQRATLSLEPEDPDRMRVAVEGTFRRIPLDAEVAARTPALDSTVTVATELQLGSCHSQALEREPVLGAWAGTADARPLGNVQAVIDGQRQRWSVWEAHRDPAVLVARPQAGSKDELTFTFSGVRLEGLRFPAAMPPPFESSAHRRGRQPMVRIDVLYTRGERAWAEHAGAGVQLEIQSFDPATGRVVGTFSGQLAEVQADGGSLGTAPHIDIARGRFEAQLP